MSLKPFIYAALSITLVAVMAGCNTTPQTDGAVIGGGLGAGLGAIIGHQSGNQGEGALIGAGAGALIGALAGNEVEHKRQRSGYYAQQPPPPTYQSAPPPSGPGHWEMRRVTTQSGETYEERIWVPHY